MVEEFEVTIPALSGNKKRRAFVYLPVGYGNGERYPVLYMFDGQNLFYDEDATYGKCWGLRDYLDYTDTPLIVAAVECNGEGNKRLEEYSPTDFMYGDKKICGKGAKYLNWLVKSFKPYIDENYLTLPDKDNTAIGGSSMGGLMSLYALSKYGRVFSKCASLSPSLWVYGGKVPEFLDNGRLNGRHTVYMDYGSKEFSNHLEQKPAFADTVRLLMECGVNVTSCVVKGGKHCEESWQKRIPFFMQTLGFFPGR